MNEEIARGALERARYALGRADLMLVQVMKDCRCLTTRAGTCRRCQRAALVDRHVTDSIREVDTLLGDRT